QALVETRRGFDPADDAEHRLRPFREMLERSAQRPAGLARDRGEAARELGSLRDCLIDEIDRLLQIRAVPVVGSGKLFPQRLEHQLDAGQYLTEPVVQIVTDLVPFPLDAVDDLALEIDPLRDVRDRNHHLVLADRHEAGFDETASAVQYPRVLPLLHAAVLERGLPVIRVHPRELGLEDVFDALADELLGTEAELA